MKSGNMTINPSTPLILDSNEYIFGISGDKASCARLMDRLDTLRVFVPAMVLQEVRRNLDALYGLGVVFFRLIAFQDNITIVWSPPPENLLQTYLKRGFAEEDAAIAATAEMVGARYIISENRHFLQHTSSLPFQVIDAETALKLL